jgi:type I restriction enzyme, S subunit
MAGEPVRMCPTVGELPDGWRVKRLGSFCTKIGTGATPRGGSEVYLSSRIGYALVRSQNVFDRHFDMAGLAFISDGHAIELRNAEVQSGDVLLNITGDGVTFGRSCIVPDSVLPACVNQHVSIIRPDRRECEAGYLLSVLTHPAAKGYIESFNSGGSRRAITKGHIESFEIPLPPLGEQKAISAILGALDDKIELNRRMNATLEAMARALFQSWFVDFDPVRAKLDGRPPAAIDRATAAFFPDSLRESVVGPIPLGWEVGRLDDALTLQRGFDLPTPDRTHGKYPVLAASGPNGCHDRFMVRGPGVTTGRSGVLGRVFFIHGDFWPLNTSLWVKEFKRVSPAYAFHVLRGLNFQVLNAGSAVPTLNRNHVHNLPVVMPPKPIVEAFDAQVMPLMKQQKANEDQSRTLATLRDTLLQKLLSGELCVAQMAKETAG